MSNQKDTTLLDDVKHRGTQAIANAFTAAVTSLPVVVVQNLMVQKGLTGDSYKNIANRLLTTGDNGRRPAFLGIKDFSVRQAKVSALGFAGVDTLGEVITSSLPDILRPFVVGAIAGGVETACTAITEKAELSDMVKNQNVRLSDVAKGCWLRNSAGWTLAAIAMSQSKGLPPDISGAIGFFAGAFAGAVTMPIQNAIVHSASSGESFDKSLNTLVRSGLGPSFAGVISRTLVMAAYTGVGIATSREVERRRSAGQQLG